MTTRENIAIGAVAMDTTGDTLRQGGNKINNNFAKLFEWAGGDSGSLTALINFDSDAIVFEGNLADSFETRIVATNPTADRTITLPDSSGTISFSTTPETLTNKTLTSPILTAPQINDTSADHQYVFAVSELADDRTITLPLLTGNDEFTFNDAIQTLTNKSLDSATLNNPNLVGSIHDANDAELITVSATASAVNYITLTNAATAGLPTIGATGTDSDVSLDFTTKGGGSVRVQKGAYASQTITADGGVPKNRSYLDLNKASALALGLNDGSTIGEFKIFTNRGAGTATITPTNFANGTSFALAQNEACQVIWNGNNWFLMGNQSVATVT